MSMFLKPDFKISLLLAVSMASVVIGCNLDPIAQDPGYHFFADNRTVLSIPNFYNAASNIIFVLAGISGSFLIIFHRPPSVSTNVRVNYLVFFSAIFLTGLASSYYHFSPDNTRLFIDRMAIAMAFMALLSIIIAEYITAKNAMVLMLLLIFIGLASVIYWYITELNGAGDLRWYGLVQFLPLVLIALILLLYPSPVNDKLYIWLVLIFYFIAKLFELNDTSVYEYTSFISGHSIKHIFAGLAPVIYLCALYHRNIKQKSR